MLRVLEEGQRVHFPFLHFSFFPCVVLGPSFFPSSPTLPALTSRKMTDPRLGSAEPLFPSLSSDVRLGQLPFPLRLCFSFRVSLTSPWAPLPPRLPTPVEQWLSPPLRTFLPWPSFGIPREALPEKVRPGVAGFLRDVFLR